MYSMTEKTQFLGFISPGSAETLVRRGGITNHHLIAYSLSNSSAKKYQNRLMCVEVIVCNIIVVFFETRCSALLLDEPIAKALRYGSRQQGDHTVLPATHTRAMLAFTPQPEHHCPWAGTHCAWPWRDARLS